MIGGGGPGGRPTYGRPTTNWSTDLVDRPGRLTFDQVDRLSTTMEIHFSGMLT